MPNLLPGLTTLGRLRELVAAEADQPTPTAFTNATVQNYNDFINRSYREVVGLLVDSFQDYFINPDTGNPFTFLTDGTSYLYDLPNDFWKMLGVDCFWQPGNLQTAVTMREFMKLERNKWQFWSQSALFIPQYKVTGSQLWLIPEPPSANLEILVRYVPVLPDMVDTGTITFVAQPTAGDTINVASSSSVPHGSAGTLPTLSNQIAYVAVGSSPARAAGRIEYLIGSSVTETAQNLADAMNAGAADGIASVPWTTRSIAQDQSVATVTANGADVTVQMLAGLAVVWSTASSGDATLPADGILLDPLPQATQWNPYASWFNFADILNGWDELVIVDAAIKIQEKQQQGTERLHQRKNDLWQIVRTQANNRNAAQNARVTNLRRLRRGFGPFTGGFGGGVGGR